MIYHYRIWDENSSYLFSVSDFRMVPRDLSNLWTVKADENLALGSFYMMMGVWLFLPALHAGPWK